MTKYANKCHNLSFICGQSNANKNGLVTNNQVNSVESVANVLLSDKERAESCHRTEKFDEFYVSSVDLKVLLNRLSRQATGLRDAVIQPAQLGFHFSGKQKFKSYPFIAGIIRT